LTAVNALQAKKSFWYFLYYVSVGAARSKKIKRVSVAIKLSVNVTIF